MEDLETDLTLAMLDRSDTKLSDRPLIVSGSLLFSETKHHIIMTVRRQEKLTVNDVLLHLTVLYRLLAAHHGRGVRGVGGGAGGHELTLLPVAESLPGAPAVLVIFSLTSLVFPFCLSWYSLEVWPWLL